MFGVIHRFTRNTDCKQCSLLRSRPIVHAWCRSGACSNESISKDRSRAYCVRSSVHVAMASTVEAQTAEEAKVCPRLSRVTGSP